MGSTRRIVAFDNVSADGYFSGAEGQLDWVISDAELQRSIMSGDTGIDTALFGRRTYDQFESFWPRALADPGTAPNPHGPGRSPESHAFAVALNEMTKVVYSRTRKDVTWHNSRLVRDFDPKAVEAMKKEPGKGIIVFGSGSIAAALTRHRLIDEYHFVVSPVLLGNGRSLLSGLEKKTKLHLQEAKGFSSGVVLLRYALSD